MLAYVRSKSFNDFGVVSEDFNRLHRSRHVITPETPVSKAEIEGETPPVHHEGAVPIAQRQPQPQPVACLSGPSESKKEKLEQLERREQQDDAIKTVSNKTKEAMARHLGNYLTELCDHWHTLFGDEELRASTRKHCRPFAASKVYRNLPEFLDQICEEVEFEASCFVNVLVYIQRLHENCPFFHLNWFNVHRILLACLLVADKVIDDDHADATRYAWISGSKLQHMCEMEMKFLGMMQHDVFVLAQEYRGAEEWLLGFTEFDSNLPCPSSFRKAPTLDTEGLFMPRTQKLALPGAPRKQRSTQRQ